MMFWWYFILSAGVAVLLTGIVRIIMRHFSIVDIPHIEERKKHKRATPLGGGIAIFGAVLISLVYCMYVGFFGDEVTHRQLIGVLIGGAVLIVGGLLDDIYNLGAKKQMIAPVIASLTIIAFGIGPHIITNPFGGVIHLGDLSLSVGVLGNIVVFADILVFFWLMGTMFTTKLLDGLDGLVSGIVAIGALMIFFLTQQPAWLQPEVSLIAIILAGACTGFLVWNFEPAKIFLGEGGSLFTGYMLGILAIISGGKIATTLLVIAVPVLDVVRVMIRRIQKKKSILVADDEHLHFKLIHSGLSQKQAVLLFYLISLLFGATTLFLQSKQKIMALLLLFILMVLVGLWFSGKEKK
ncbi:MAG: undecaprenyl/decaprenyl-phosphate alpha-N-acetylglucosaminyl 1-phosphate transferase [Candidatus Magasanikbacteria bacterium]|jgi:UDP-GlcNAc:undecaprenyl-phosphate/decaprenyl-phosphate GlcNAc-1-phosphate transferase|nr:undecaprenyl/decaprenyl-phosphate alpha-N-acetylglucosaminyl 1-phosphate transferase [Candidatus Magasanikbacteria bacterium]MBT4221070.1 undecaprenyl/decaprenyl-phosphate alpha-N-acetylglucosaminyl 1-phosphate transferase [Candidatus Magasanikbacteria bacterium]MBT4350586.1 undecaprenyl/decaprenyl-phosphate alpha-N-acetylglucosaminyl 1-phosphate transferase [Candidatus Magasanikbacteria bacterium]MBT4542115.1 undecaprenyl/decaprenyl-phosphate alpha-N-acetylglucosaminyl 1-phosphate transferas